MVLWQASGSLAAKVIKTNIDTVFNVFRRENALLIVRTLFVALAEVLRWNVTLSSGVACKARQTLTDGLVSTANAVGVDATANARANIRAVLHSREHSPARLKFSTKTIVGTTVLYWLAARFGIIWIAIEVGSTFTERLVGLSATDGVDATEEFLANTFTFTETLWVQDTNFILLTIAIQ